MRIANFLHRFRIGLIPLIVFALPGRAQVSFNTLPSASVVGLHDYLRVEFNITGAREIERLDPPIFKDFNIVQGPEQSTGMSDINGVVSRSRSVSFVLRPLRTGRLRIDGARAVVDGKALQSQPVTVQVNVQSPGGAQGGGSPPAGFSPMPPPGFPDARGDIDREYLLKPSESIPDKIRKNLFARATVSKNVCYAGEPIVATYKLYSRLQSESRVTKHPSLNGFSVYDMTDPNSDATTIERVGGRPFVVHAIRQAQLIPLQPGTVTLDSVTLDNTVHFLRADGNSQGSSGGSMGDLFDRLFNGGPSGTPVDQRVSIASNPVTITVKPLPEAGRPGNFSGAVGQYTISAALRNTAPFAGEDAVLVVTLKGHGNLPMVNEPSVAWPQGIETFQEATQENIDKTVAPLGGSKTFEFHFVASAPQAYEIPPVSFSYFDPASGTYKTDTTAAIRFTARPGRQTAASRHPESASAAGPLFGVNARWLTGLGLLFVACLSLAFWVRGRRKESEDAKAARRAARTATRIRARDKAAGEPGKPEPKPAAPPDPLGQARPLLEAGDYSGFYRQVNRVIWDAISRALRMPASEMSKAAVGDALLQRGWGPVDVALLRDTLSECEWKLYTPDYNAFDAQRLLTEADRVLARLEAIAPKA